MKVEFRDGEWQPIDGKDHPITLRVRDHGYGVSLSVSHGGDRYEHWIRNVNHNTWENKEPCWMLDFDAEKEDRAFSILIIPETDDEKNLFDRTLGCFAFLERDKETEYVLFVPVQDYFKGIKTSDFNNKVPS